MKVNLFVGGFGKCGTTSLHQYLSVHPEICMSSTKEPHFFSAFRMAARGEDWYESLFSEGNSNTLYYGESSTTYAIWEPALEKIIKRTTSPKLILILRDPVSRVLSHYRWMFARGFEKRSLEDALSFEENEEFSPDRHRHGCYWHYMRSSKYSLHVPIAQSLFGEENVLLLRTEDLAGCPQGVLDKCFSFLGLRSVVIDSSLNANATRDIRCVRSNIFMQVYRSLIPGYLRKNGFPLKRTIKRLATHRRVAPEPLPATITMLAEKLEPDRAVYLGVESIVCGNGAKLVEENSCSVGGLDN